VRNKEGIKERSSSSYQREWKS